MFCAISGEAPLEPVVCPETGLVYERRLLLKALADSNGKCPVTGKDVDESRLITMDRSATTVKPRAPTATSLPTLLGTFQNEWDALMLETYALKRQYQQCRQELATALYQQDAAVRVIARLVKERDEARASLANLEGIVGPGGKASKVSPMEIDSDTQPSLSLSEDASTLVKETAEHLVSTRKARRAAAPVAQVDSVAAWKVDWELPSLHTASRPGITAMALQGSRILTAGLDKTILVHDLTTDREIGSMKLHKDRVADVAWLGEEEVISASDDRVVRLWRQPGGKGSWKSGHMFKCHTAPATAVAAHPSNKLFLSAGQDGLWAIHDPIALKTLLQVPTDGPIHTAAFHPDGAILATGKEGLVKVYDVRQAKELAVFEGFSGPVSSIRFSENGYHMAAAAEQGGPQIWDLRHLRQLHTLPVPEPSSSLSWDASGSYLAVGTIQGSVRIFRTKQWSSPVLTWSQGEGEGQAITGLSWSSTGDALYTASMDRTVRRLSQGDQ
ncbi:MAG: WD40-repeat-containing domain protein [Piptocephalis tieghemiana]|nr:MAG: WD40-repeat-containing domain protein [Piptocephalis tieghemiana]